MFESNADEVTFQSVPFGAVFRRSEPGRVRQIVVDSVGSLQGDREVVFPSLGPSSLFPVPFVIGSHC